MRRWLWGTAIAIFLALIGGFLIGPSLFPQNSPSSSPNPSPTLTREGETGKIKVVTSTQVWADITMLLAGDWVEVTAIVPENQDPHSYQATARDQLLISEAELVIANGGGYDDFLDQLVAATDKDLVFLKLVEGEHSHTGEQTHTQTAEDSGHSHDSSNEHIWFDFEKTLDAAEHITEALVEIRPEAFQSMTAGFDFFSGELATLEVRLEALRERALGLGFIAPEGVANLMLANAGFENMTPEELADAIEEDREVPLAALTEAKLLLENRVAAILVVNLSTGDPVTDQLIAAAEAGNRPIIKVSETALATATALEITELDYLDWMNLVIDQLQEAIY